MRCFPLVFAALCALSAAAPAWAGDGRPDNPGWEKVEAAFQRKDYVLARRIAEELAAKGDPEAINGLAVLVGQGVGAAPDPRRAQQLMERAMPAGSVGAKLNMARALAVGADQSQWPRALTLLQEVAKEPRLSPATHYPLGRIMIFNDPSSEALRQGVEHLKLAAGFEPNNADAQFLAGRAYQAGWGGSERDPAKAFTYFLAAAKLGDGRALRNVGMARLTGEGAEKDPTAAFADFKSAAGLGNVDAMIDVAVMLATGEGVTSDPPQARDWYRKAAGLGAAHALRGLGAMLYFGEGGASDPILGRAYLELAADAGDALAVRVVQERFSELSAADRAAVDQAKADWLAGHSAPKVG